MYDTNFKLILKFMTILINIANKIDPCGNPFSSIFSLARINVPKKMFALFTTTNELILNRYFASSILRDTFLVPGVLRERDFLSLPSCPSGVE